MCVCVKRFESSERTTRNKLKFLFYFIIWVIRREIFIKNNKLKTNRKMRKIIIINKKKQIAFSVLVNYCMKNFEIIFFIEFKNY